MTLDNSFSGVLIISQMIFQKTPMTMHASVVGLWKLRVSTFESKLVNFLAVRSPHPHLPESVSDWARLHPSRLKPRGRDISILCVRAHVLVDYDSVDK